VDRRAFLDGLKYDAAGLVVAIAQDADTGEILMQAFASAEAVAKTLDTGMATFYSRSRQGLWTKGETSGNFIGVREVYVDCNRDALVYLSVPRGPACHTGRATCFFTRVAAGADGLAVEETPEEYPRMTLQALEDTIRRRDEEAAAGGGAGGKPSWTAKLLGDEALLCSKVREEAGELCETLERAEGKERAASEMADLLYHSAVLLRKQGVEMKDVMAVLRQRFGTSGVEEKASRKQTA